MAKVNILGGKGTVELDDAVFGVEFNEALVHQNVRHELNARRQGTHKAKTRGEVSGGGKKPWKQKGTGRARAGSSRSPIWTGGGTVFGPQPRSYTFKVNRKEKQAALRSVLSLHVARESAAALEASNFDKPSTKSAADLVAGWDGKGKVLLVVGSDDLNAGLSFRNLPGVNVISAEGVGVSDIAAASRLLLATSAVEPLTARALGKKEKVS